jgi:hypothetical protein
VAANPVPRGLPTRRERPRPGQGVPLVRAGWRLPRILSPAEVDALMAALFTHRDRAMVIRSLPVKPRWACCRSARWTRTSPDERGCGEPAITMSGAIMALVAEKRAVGFKYDTEERVLARFAAFSASRFPGLEAPDRASVEA